MFSYSFIYLYQSFMLLSDETTNGKLTFKKRSFFSAGYQLTSVGGRLATTNT